MKGVYVPVQRGSHARLGTMAEVLSGAELRAGADPQILAIRW